MNILNWHCNLWVNFNNYARENQIKSFKTFLEQNFELNVDQSNCSSFFNVYCRTLISKSQKQ